MKIWTINNVSPPIHGTIKFNAVGKPKDFGEAMCACYNRGVLQIIYKPKSA